MACEARWHIQGRSSIDTWSDYSTSLMAISFGGRGKHGTWWISQICRFAHSYDDIETPHHTSYHVRSKGKLTGWASCISKVNSESCYSQAALCSLLQWNCNIVCTYMWNVEVEKKCAEFFYFFSHFPCVCFFIIGHRLLWAIFQVFRNNRECFNLRSGGECHFHCKMRNSLVGKWQGNHQKLFS